MRQSVLLAATLVVLVAATAHAESPLATRVHRYLMGTSITIEVTGGNPASRAAVIEDAFAAMVEVDRLMSNYRTDSELARVNREAAVHPVAVSPPLWDVLVAARRVSRDSHGAFDVTVGPLVRLWGFHDKRPHVPTPDELQRIRGIVGQDQLVLNDQAHTVAFRRSGVELDLGGIAKGFAVELAGGVLRRRGFAGFIDAGGNQYLVGKPTTRPVWQVGIEDPDHPDHLLGVLTVDGGAVATSGGYHNFFTQGGHTYSHLLDPRTLHPSEAALSVTVVGPDATLADALSKPAFMLGPEAGLRLVEASGAQAVIASRGAGGRVLLTMSPGLRARFVAAPAPRPHAAPAARR